jgi:hypothetical protein
LGSLSEVEYILKIRFLLKLEASRIINMEKLTLEIVVPQAVVEEMTEGNEQGEDVPDLHQYFGVTMISFGMQYCGFQTISCTSQVNRMMV